MAAAAAALPPHTVVNLVAPLLMGWFMLKVEAMWCVARSEAGEQALQTALDYACNAGADCTPLQPSGLCFLPNTIQAHASYAFNSYYQRKGNAPGSCNFAGTATIAKSDPSYGSCDYPSSSGASGGTPTASKTPGGANTPTMVPIAPPPPGTTPPYGNGGLTPGVENGGPNYQNSKVSLEFCIANPPFLASFMLVLAILL